MVWSPQASPQDHLTLLRHPGWTLHQGWCSPDGRLHLYTFTAPWHNPCWDSQHLPGDQEDAVPGKGSSLLARHRSRYSQLCLKMHYLHQTQGFTACPACASQDIPNGLWQEISADYFHHNSKDYLLVCDIFSKYTFLFKVNSMSTYSLSQRIQELISQYGTQVPSTWTIALPSHWRSLSNSCSGNTLNTSTHPHTSPNPMASLRGRWKHWRLPSAQARMLEEPLMTSYWNYGQLPLPLRCQHPERSSTTGWSKAQARPQCPSTWGQSGTVSSQKAVSKDYFDRAHNIKPLSTLDPGQEVLFLFLTDHHTYFPGTVLDKASMPRSYTIKAQDKWYCRTREHICPLQQDLFQTTPIP